MVKQTPGRGSTLAGRTAPDTRVSSPVLQLRGFDRDPQTVVERF